MNAIAQPHKARNFSDWCRRAYYASQITVTGKPDDFQIQADDLVLDAAYEWLIAGHLTDAGGQVEINTVFDFCTQEMTRDLNEEKFMRFVYDLLTSKITVETARRAYVTYLIETYEREHLARLEFPKVAVDEPYSDRVNIPAQRVGGEV
jgi:hypothetical protein